MQDPAAEVPSDLAHDGEGGKARGVSMDGIS